MLRGERIALMGRNGSGKTSLLKALLANAPGVDFDKQGEGSGKVLWGHEVQIGLFAQDHRESIQKGLTVFEWLNQFDVNATREELRGLLGKMLFAQEEGMKPTDALSGGEAARLIFCKLMLQQPNFLVLDEPTNHLDLEAINALNVALQRYEGTVLLVTHDHDLIDEVATRLWSFDHGTDRRFPRHVRRAQHRKSVVPAISRPVFAVSNTAPRNTPNSRPIEN